MPAARTDEFRIDLAHAIRNNDSIEDRTKWWLNCRNDIERSRWLLIGVEIDAISHVELEEALQIFDPKIATALDWVRCVEAGRFDVGFYDQTRHELFSRALGDGISPLSHTSPCNDAGNLSLYRNLVSKSRYIRARRTYKDSRLPEGPNPVAGVTTNLKMSDTAKDLERLLEAARLEYSPGNSRSFLGALSGVITIAQEIFGESWLCWSLALLGATVSGCPVNGATGFFDRSRSLLSRARKAKLSANDLDFWNESASKTTESLGTAMAIYTAAFSWADPSVLVSIMPKMADGWMKLTQYQIRDIRAMIQPLSEVAGVGRNAVKNISKSVIRKIPDVPASMLSMLYFRTEEQADPFLIGTIRRKFEEGDPEELVNGHQSLTASVLLHYSVMSWKSSGPWKRQLNDISRFYNSVTHGSLIHVDPYISEYIPESNIARTANAILAEPFEYPGRFVAMADAAASSRVAQELQPLREIAIQENWFAGLPF